MLLVCFSKWKYGTTKNYIYRYMFIEENSFNISSYKAVGECYDPVLSYLFAREDHIVTETAKNTKEIVMVSKLNR